MEINPKKAGQCWSCKYCEDIGTQTYEDYVTYIRQCNHPRHDIIDNCERQCDHYVWDGKHKEYWRPEIPAPSYSESSDSTFTKPASSAAPSKGSIAAVLVIVAALIVIGVILFLLFRPTQATTAGFPESIGGMEESGPDTADYSLAGAIRFVSTQSGNGLNVRARPNADADIVTAIPDNQLVTIQKTQDSWAYVSWEGCEGWCSMDYLITEEAYTQLMQNYLNIPAIVATESSDLRLRETPSLNSEPIESMPKGSQIIVLRLEGDWAYVDYQGMSGWCAAEYLDIQE